jgi:CO/xanthine dehydrogenase FAD-binding subunit
VRTFAYVRPVQLEEAASALSRPAARAMGGGTDLLTQQDRGILPAESVVDLRGLGLDAIASEGDGVRIGATVTLADLGRDDAVRERFAVLNQAASAAASPQLREMGTVTPTWPAGCAAATPATPRSATTASTGWSRATASRSRPATWPRRCWRWTQPSRPAAARRGSRWQISTARPARRTAPPWRWRRASS